MEAFFGRVQHFLDFPDKIGCPQQPRIVRNSASIPLRIMGFGLAWLITAFIRTNEFCPGLASGTFRYHLKFTKRQISRGGLIQSQLKSKRLT